MGNFGRGGYYPARRTMNSTFFHFSLTLALGLQAIPWDSAPFQVLTKHLLCARTCVKYEGHRGE